MKLILLYSAILYVQCVFARHACPPLKAWKCSCRRGIHDDERETDFFVECDSSSVAYVATFHANGRDNIHLTVKGVNPFEISDISHNVHLKSIEVQVNDNVFWTGEQGVLKKHVPKIRVLKMSSPAGIRATVNFANGTLGFVRDVIDLRELHLDHMNRGPDVKVTQPLFDGLHLNSLARLTLTGNKIRSFSRDAFIGLPNLTFVDLSRNALRTIEYLNFPGMKNVREFHLRRNRIHEIEDESFLSMTKLRILDLSHNEIESLSRGTFRELEETLVKIVLNHNRLKSIPTAALQNISSLADLQVKSNQIYGINKGDFAGDYQLKHLFVGDNPLSAYTKDMFADVHDSLKTLGLQRLVLDDIGSFPVDALKGFQLLKTLDISEGFMSKIPSLYFAGLPHSIQKIVLERMYISEIEPNGFGNLTYPLDVSLRENELSSLDFVLDAPPCTFLELDVRHNPVSCDCALSNILHTKRVPRVIGHCVRKTGKKSEKVKIGGHKLLEILSTNCNSTQLEIHPCALQLAASSSSKIFSSISVLMTVTMLLRAIYY